jgi:hypothetical protein
MEIPEIYFKINWVGEGWNIEYGLGEGIYRADWY